MATSTMRHLSVDVARAIARSINDLVGDAARASVNGVTDEPCHDRFVLAEGGLRIAADLVPEGSFSGSPVPMFVDINVGSVPGTYDVHVAQPYVLFAAPHCEARAVPAEKLSEAVTALGTSNTGAT